MKKETELDDEPNEDFGYSTKSKATKGRAYQLWQYTESFDRASEQRNYFVRYVSGMGILSRPLA